MLDQKKLEYIKLDGETVFEHNIKQDKEKYEIYKKAKEEGKIKEFDPIIIHRLRKLYYGLLTGLIYMYYYPTDFGTLGNKAEIFTHAIKDKNYKLVHGTTNSSRNIPFFRYGENHLDWNSWFEVEEGNKEWVYDLFSLLKIEKNIYYKLEDPYVNKIYSKEELTSHPGRVEDEYDTYHNGFDYLLLDIIPDIEKRMETHPYKNLLKPELDRFKYEIDYERIVLENKEIIKRNNKKK